MKLFSNKIKWEIYGFWLFVANDFYFYEFLLRLCSDFAIDSIDIFFFEIIGQLIFEEIFVCILCFPPLKTIFKDYITNRTVVSDFLLFSCRL
uniref:Uncharacterized protein n=1 Tax=Onchocerca volvulus TaxID=6282 RepID=A0A044UMA2_ONCVO